MKQMKGLAWFSLLFLTFFILFPTIISSRHISQQNSRRGHHHSQQRKAVAATTTMEQNVYRERGPETVDVAGSRLPDCSHACGSCSPCRLVMISFVCASLEEAETCPMAYRCMCNHKSYPVP